MAMLLIAAALVSAAEPSSADLAFMIGEWQLRGAFDPEGANERVETGSQKCDFVMDRAYVRCDRTLRSADGRQRQQVTFHNYNRLYRRFEHLFVSSNWPTKVIGHSALHRSGSAAEMIIEISFALPDGRTEQVRSRDRYSGDAFQSDEQLRVGDGEWRTNYRLTGTRTGKQ